MIDKKDNLCFLYEVDCEPLAEKSPACGGPISWEVSEKAILCYADIFRDRGMMEGLGFELTPEAAKAHTNLFLDLRKEGCHIGLQLNVPGFRFPRYKYDLGHYEESEQREIIRAATSDFQDTLGFSPESYCPCCGSKNRFTYPLLVEFGYRQARAPVTGRYLLDRPDRCTVGCYPYPHWASRHHHLLAGDLPLLVIPGTGDLVVTRGARPFDLRSEWPPTEETRQKYRQVIDQHIEVMNLTSQPMQVIVAASHNTERVNFENVEYVVDYVAESADRAGLRLTPANCSALWELAKAGAMPPYSE